jgi:hypothetical protein
MLEKMLLVLVVTVWMLIQVLLMMKVLAKKRMRMNMGMLDDYTELGLDNFLNTYDWCF